VRLQSCRAQKGISVVGKGACPDSGEPGNGGGGGRTELPMRQWTSIDFKEPGEELDGFRLNLGGKKLTVSQGTKSTRHISTHMENVNQIPTTVTYQVRKTFTLNSVSLKCIPFNPPHIL